MQGHTERAILPLGSWGFQNKIGGEPSGASELVWLPTREGNQLPPPEGAV